MKPSARTIFGMFTVLAVGLLALGAWRVFFDTTLYPDLANTLSVFFWFSLLGTSFFLGAVVWRHWTLPAAAAIALLFPSLLFVHTWHHAIFVCLSSLLVFWSAVLVQQEIEGRVRFHFFRNVRAGSFVFIFGLSLALSSAYFSSIQTESWERLVSRFSVGEGTATVLFKTVAYLYPEWKNLADKGMTVDGFLLSLKKEGESAENSTPNVLSAELMKNNALWPAFSEYVKQGVLMPNGIENGALAEELALLAGREQIALLVGKPVSGDEQIADVFSLAIQHKIITALSGEQASQHISPAIVPVILALLLFLTLLPIGSILSVLWIAGSFLLFRLARHFGWVRLERVQREQEILLP